MPTRKVPLINGYYYHIYNRVIRTRKLFYSQEDYISYLKLWKEVDFSSCCQLCAYCLMPNHYHYLVRITDDDLFPRKVSHFFNRYLKLFSNLRKESGRYFDNRFQAKWVDNEKYLMAVCCYIHLNPIEAKLVTSLEQWPYSNYMEFIGKRNGTLWDTVFFDQYIQSPQNYERYMISKYIEEDLEPYVFEGD